MPPPSSSVFDCKREPWVGISFDESSADASATSTATKLNFTIHYPPNPTLSTLTLSRDVSEPVTSSLTRMLLNVRKKWLKKGGLSPLVADDVTITLSSLTKVSSTPIPLPLAPSVLNSREFWKEAEEANVVFNIPTPVYLPAPGASPLETVPFRLVLSPPILPQTSISLYLAGKYDLYSNTPVAIATTDVPSHVSLSYSWVKSTDPSHPTPPSSSPYYVPSPEDVGSRLRCIITPSTPTTIGLPVTVNFPNPILPVPSSNPLFTIRSPFLSTPLPSPPSSLRIVTYNILAELYTSQKPQQKQMWGYTNSKFLHASYRMPLILCELIHHAPTLLLLQEVDTSAYDTFFSPVLSALGYEGVFGEKCGNQREGVAIFWRSDEFELIESQCIPVRDLSANPPPSSSQWELPSLNNFIEAHQNLHDIMSEKVGTVCLFATLRSRKVNDKKVVLTNTHLFYHPLADHIRLLQTYFILHKASVLAEQHNAGIIVGGDFNSDPPSGACQLMMTRSVAPNTPTHDECFSNLHRLKWGDRGALPPPPKASDIDSSLPPPPPIKLPPKFPQLFNAVGFPPFTNYAVGFVAQLDYIFPSSSHFELIRTAPSLQQSHITNLTAMPNEFMPSDHVLLCAEISWKEDAK